MNTFIKRATLQDIERLLEIEKHCFTESRISRRSFRHLISKGNCITLCLWIDKMIHGYAMIFFRKNSARARIYSIAILKSHEGLGLGKLLMRHIEMSAKKQKARSLSLEVKQTNRRAIQLYRNMGFHIIKEIPDYYEDGHAALQMLKSIAKKTNG